MILHLVDGTLDDVASAYRTIREELAAYGHGLAGKPEIVGLNKIDALDPAAATTKLRQLRHTAGRGAKVVPLSGVTGAGVPGVLAALFTALAEEPAAQHSDERIEA